MKTKLIIILTCFSLFAIAQTNKIKSKVSFPPLPVAIVTVPTLSNSVTLIWDKSPDSDVVGYKVYRGGLSRTYTNSITLSNVTTVTIANVWGTNYYAATAYDDFGLESDFSNEIKVRSSPIVPNWRYTVWARTGEVGQARSRAFVVKVFTNNSPGLLFDLEIPIEVIQ